MAESPDLEEREVESMAVKAVVKEYDVQIDGLPNMKEKRYVLVDTETGEIVDDSQGCGYKTAQGAYKAYGWKKTHRRKKESEGND